MKFYSLSCRSGNQVSKFSCGKLFKVSFCDCTARTSHGVASTRLGRKELPTTEFTPRGSLASDAVALSIMPTPTGMDSGASTPGQQHKYGERSHHHTPGYKANRASSPRTRSWYTACSIRVGAMLLSLRPQHMHDFGEMMDPVALVSMFLFCLITGKYYGHDVSMLHDDWQS
jgi:hypothetical protein